MKPKYRRQRQQAQRQRITEPPQTLFGRPVHISRPAPFDLAASERGLAAFKWQLETEEREIVFGTFGPQPAAPLSGETCLVLPSPRGGNFPAGDVAVDVVHYRPVVRGNARSGQIELYQLGVRVRAHVPQPFIDGCVFLLGCAN